MRSTYDQNKQVGLVNESRFWLTAWLQRPIAVIAWSSALLMAGTWAAFNVPVEWVPQVELPEVRIDVFWPGASPRQMERYVTAPIERSVQTVPGTVSIESLSEEGVANIGLSVAEDIDLGAYVTQINDRLALLRNVLPDRVQPQLTKRVPEALRDEQGFITLQVVGPLLPDELRRLAEERLAPKLRSISGVGDLKVEGGTERELLISMDPELLVTYNIEPDYVRGKIFDAMRDEVYGRLNARGHAALLISPAEERKAAIGNLVVRPSKDGVPPVHLREVASLALGPAPRRTISRIDGNPVVTLLIDRSRGSHMIAVAETIHERLAELRPSLPDGVRLLVADDRTESVRAQLRDLLWRGGLGLVLVILVLLFMLKSVRAASVVLFSVAVALALSIALLRPLGLTLNLITFAGLVLIFGLLVDNSVVIVEQLALKRPMFAKSGLSRVAVEVATTRAALRAVWLPLLGGTLSTIAVMLPLIYLSGELRTLFVPFAALVSMTLLISLASAALLVPVLGRFLPEVTEPARARWLRRVTAAPYRWVTKFPKTTLVVLFLLLGTPLWLLPDRMAEPRDGWSEPKRRLAEVYNETLGVEWVQSVRKVANSALGGVLRPFIESVNFGKAWNYNVRPEASVRMQFPPGNPIGRADSLMQRFEQVALASPSVYRTLVRISERSASMRVQFHEDALLTSEPYLVRERLIRQAVLIGGMYISVHGLLPQGFSSGYGGSSSSVSLRAFGPNYEDLEAMCERFAQFLRRRSRRVADVNINSSRYGWMSEQTRQVLRFRWDADAQARAGATAHWLSGRLRPVFSTRFPMLRADLEGETRLPVRLIIDGADWLDVDRVVDRPMIAADSSLLRLAGLADYTIVETPAGIQREDQQYVRNISVDYRGPYDMANKFRDAALEEFPVPAGYRLEKAESWFFTDEVASAFLWVFLGTIFLVFLVTAAVFESWRLPVVVMLSVPMAAIGVGLGFLWTEASFAEGAFIGTVLLVGIAVNDSILLTDRYRQLRQLRPGTFSGILARLAVRERLRPMWTTTLTSVAAMLPLLLFPDDGDFWMGLAVTVVGGLLASTLLAPFAAVALLSLRRRARTTLR